MFTKNDSIHSESIHYPIIIMTYTTLPSVKGQITIPSEIREKYNIGKETPIVVEDQGNGLITMKVMRMIDHDAVEYYENDKEFGLNFKNGIDPRVLMDAIKKIDG